MKPAAFACSRLRAHSLLSLLLAGLAFGWAPVLPAAPASLTVDVDKPGHAISPTLYGIFFEDINCSADGGLYAELVRNRNFEDSDKPDFWSVVSSGQAAVDLSIDSSQPASPKNPKSLKVQIANPGAGRAGVANNGFWGISLKSGQTYQLAFMAGAGRVSPAR